MIPPTRHNNPRTQARSTVLEMATKLFHTQGIKNVTMDDISHRLSMSKRTLYQLFSDKEDLLLACVKLHHEREHERMVALAQKSDNVLDFILANYRQRMEETGDVVPSFYADILKYPKVIEFIENHQAAVEDEAVEFLNRGKDEGYFRADVNFHIVYRSMKSIINHMIAEERTEQFTNREIFTNSLIVLLRGCATLKGIESIDRVMGEIG